MTFFADEDGNRAIVFEAELDTDYYEANIHSVDDVTAWNNLVDIFGYDGVTIVEFI